MLGLLAVLHDRLGQVLKRLGRAGRHAGGEDSAVGELEYAAVEVVWGEDDGLSAVSQWSASRQIAFPQRHGKKRRGEKEKTNMNQLQIPIPP